MTTIKQIAEELGVSPTTVSNVINGRTGKMSLETRRKIEEALWENHYETAGKSSGGRKYDRSGLLHGRILQRPY